MPRFLIDVNLPYRFGLWKGDDYLHQFDLGDEWSDEKIWDYAKSNDLTIISKDADFSNKILFRTPPPKVIHIRVGNMKMRDFHVLMNAIWPQVLEMSERNKLVNVFADRIEGID
jgi:predicted nuclease of predicted toxin-antitoxin system